MTKEIERMQRIVGLAIVLALFVMLSPGNLSAQQKAPNFTLKTTDGKTVELSKLKGKAVIVNFWATWCGPCRREIPGFVNIYEKYKAKGLEIVGISVDRDGVGVVKQYLEKNKVTYPIVWDDKGVADAYGKLFGAIDGIPTTFFVDRSGNVVDKYIGSMEESAFEAKVKKLL